MKKFQVAPFDQHLTCNGRDLNDNQATLASLRIYPGTVIILKVSCRKTVVIVFVVFPVSDAAATAVVVEQCIERGQPVRDESMARIRGKSSPSGTHRSPFVLVARFDAQRALQTFNTRRASGWRCSTPGAQHPTPNKKCLTRR